MKKLTLKAPVQYAEISLDAGTHTVIDPIANRLLRVGLIQESEVQDVPADTPAPAAAQPKATRTSDE